MKSQEEQWLLTEKYDGVKSEAFYADCKALALGTPLGYLIGHVPFLDCIIYLDNHPLIPRVETEWWVERAIAAIKMSSVMQPSLDSGVPAAPRVLDLCAGSGCIGVATAKAIPDALVDFGELSARLIPTIKKNCIENGIASDRYDIYHSNLFSQIPSETKYDYVLSNPPYIDPAIDRATESVKSHEPHLALYGGTNGLEVIEQLIATATSHLTANGQIWIEHEPEQVNGIAKLAEQYGFNCVSHLDQYGVERYSILVVQ
jgi:ribosomal protein L3 glutamine methyltransferase